MTKTYFFTLLLGLGFLIGCSDDDGDSGGTGGGDEEFVEQYSFTLAGTDYEFTGFTVKTDWLETDNRLFITKEDGDDRFNLNFPLDLPTGANGMDWNGGGAFFFVRFDQGDFYTLDEATSTLNVIEVDTVARTISATFSGVGSQAVSDETVSFSDGILKAKY